MRATIDQASTSKQMQNKSRPPILFLILFGICGFLAARNPSFDKVFRLLITFFPFGAILWGLFMGRRWTGKQISNARVVCAALVAALLIHSAVLYAYRDIVVTLSFWVLVGIVAAEIAILAVGIANIAYPGKSRIEQP